MMIVRLHILFLQRVHKVLMLMIWQQVFDYGEYKNQPDAACRVMESLMDAMRGNIKPKNKLKIVQAHDSVVFRMAKVGGKNLGQLIVVAANLANARQAPKVQYWYFRHLVHTIMARLTNLRDSNEICKRHARVLCGGAEAR